MMPPSSLSKKPKIVLFDLDGTLADSAPDLAGAINAVRIERGLAPVPYEQLRPVASAGAPGLIKAAFQLTQQDALYATLRERFLLSYANNIAVKTTLFAGIPELLKQLRKTGIGWGIVTNKVSSLTHPLVKKIGLDDVSFQAIRLLAQNPFLTRFLPRPKHLMSLREIAGLSETIYAIFRPANQPERPRLRPSGDIVPIPRHGMQIFSPKNLYTYWI